MTETKEIISSEMNKLYALAARMADRKINPIERLELLGWAREFKDKITGLLLSK